MLHIIFAYYRCAMTETCLKETDELFEKKFKLTQMLRELTFPGALFTICIDHGEWDDVLLAGNTIKLLMIDPCTYNTQSSNIICTKEEHNLSHKYQYRQPDDILLLTLTSQFITKITIKEVIEMLISIQYKPLDGHIYLELFEQKYDTQFGVYFKVYFGS